MKIAKGTSTEVHLKSAVFYYREGWIGYYASDQSWHWRLRGSKKTISGILLIGSAEFRKLFPKHRQGYSSVIARAIMKWAINTYVVKKSK